MEPRSSLPHSQEPATCPYSETHQSLPGFPYHFFNTHFNIIFPSLSRCSKWSLSLRSPYQNPVCISPVSDTFHMPHRSHCFWFYGLNNIWWGLQIVRLFENGAKYTNCVEKIQTFVTLEEVVRAVTTVFKIGNYDRQTITRGGLNVVCHTDTWIAVTVNPLKTKCICFI
jgi:hypothetical protein